MAPKKIMFLRRIRRFLVAPASLPARSWLLKLAGRDAGAPRALVSTLLLALLIPMPVSAADSFNWSTNQNRVTADIQYRNLAHLLEQIAAITGWQIYLE